MDYQDLKETTMDPKTRVLKKVTVSDIEKVSEVLNICMGNQIDLKREFIEANAHKVSLNFD